MAYMHCDLALTTGLNDGTSWADAYQNSGGLVTAFAAGSAGDFLYVKNDATSTAARTYTGPTTLAAITNPMRVLGVKSATTNEGASIVMSDLIPGLRTGDSTRAQDQTGANKPPTIDTGSNSNADMIWRGCIYMYGFNLITGDNCSIAPADLKNKQHWEECALVPDGSTDEIIFGSGANANALNDSKVTNCTIGKAATPCLFKFFNGIWIDFLNCEFITTSAGAFQFNEFRGKADLYACDLSACNATLFNITSSKGGRVNLISCGLPASHILTTGTANEYYKITNVHSGNQSALGSTDSVQAFEQHTLEGVVDLETTAVRTGGADDGGNGPHGWALTANNVTDNYAFLTTPWCNVYVDGDGTAKTVTMCFANDDTESAGNLLDDDQVYLELIYPSATGVAQYDYMPDENAPSSGTGRTQLLDTPVVLATDVSTWGTGANNKQKVSQSVSPDYQGIIKCRLHYSKSVSAPVLFVDPIPKVT